MRGLAADAGTLPVEEKDWTGFQRVVVLEMIRVFLTSGDRESLVTLFSKRCPSRSHVIEIEKVLVFYGDKITHPIRILGDAYSKCQSPEVKTVLANSLRRGFKGSGIRANNDAEFVANAMRWYDQEKERLVYNEDYGGMLGPFETYIRQPLFKQNPLLVDNASAPANSTPPSSSDVRTQWKPVKAAENAISMKLMLLPAGTFWMGSPDNGNRNEDEERPLHPVRITKPFWLGSCEVTQAQYELISGKNPSWFAQMDDLPDGVSKADLKRFPVESVTNSPLI